MKKLIKQSFRSLDLKKNYLILYQIGLILSLSIITIFFRVNFASKANDYTSFIIEDEILFLEEAIQTKQEVKAPPPQRPVVPIEVPNDEIIEDEIIFMDSELHFDELTPLPLPPPSAKEKEDEEPEIFVVVEQPPILIGGLAELQKKIRYPSIAIDAGIEGRVIVQFIINAQGEVYNPTIIRGIGAGCDEEAVRVVKLAKFKPGMQRGKAVSVKYTIPISFKLSTGD